MENYDGKKGIVNIGTGEDLTINELAHESAEVVGYTGEISYDSSKPDGTMRKLMDSTRLNQLGWRPSTILRHGLVKAYQNFKQLIG
jgi:nucleoside-diphosphate-sugar epimerase